MPKLFLLESHKADTTLFSASNEVVLHEDILEVLFTYKEKICNSFYDICGTFFIDHLAINIIDPDGRLVIFSTTPSVEYNLISQDLWKYDRSFSLSYQTDNRFTSWEKAYEEKHREKLKYTKQSTHGFTCGFNISKNLESFHIIYSFATRYQKHDLLKYYHGYINELFSIGDYVFKAVSGVYDQKFGKMISRHETDCDKVIRTFPPFLKLISSKE